VPFDVLTHANSYTVEGAIDGVARLSGLGVPLQMTTEAVIGDTTATEIINGAVDLGLIFRHVELADLMSVLPVAPWPPFATAQQVIQPGGAPGVPDVNVIVNAGLAAAPAPGSVEAWAGKITGTVPIGFRVIPNPVRVDFRWNVLDEHGEALPADQYSVYAGSLDSANLSLAFRPEFTEWNAKTASIDALDPTRTVKIQAEVRVRLEATGDDSDWVKIPPEKPPLAIPLRPIPLPALAAMFRTTYYRGTAMLLLTPDKAVFADAGAALAAISQVRAIVEELASVGRAAAWSLGLEGLVGVVATLADNQYTHVGWLAGYKYDDLRDYEFIEVFGDNPDIEDRTSSLIVLSPDRRITFWQDVNRGGQRLTVMAPADRPASLGGVLVPDLHAQYPQSYPGGVVNTSGTPDDEDKWGNVISSYEWS
jgi:hypothetical protein